MVNIKHADILELGTNVWNTWRQENSDVQVNLEGTNLSEADLRGINFREVDFMEADLMGADLRHADLREANLRGGDLRDTNLMRAKLRKADLRGTNFIRANLREADLSVANVERAKLCETDLAGANLSKAILMRAELYRAQLMETDLTGANLSDADLGRAIMIQTKLEDVDLSETKSLDKVKHSGPSIIGLNTIKKSKGKIPGAFLLGCGLSDYEIEIVKLWRKGLDRNEVTDIAYDLVNLYCGDGLQFYSCFISYNNADEAFARKLHDDLQDNGVRCWFAPEDMKIGDRIRPRIDQEIRLRDKLLVILSENSVESEWVGDEVEAALEEEGMDGRTILFPIRLDNAVMDVRRDWAAKIRRRRHIGDFTSWQEEGQYQQGFQRLLSDLKATDRE